MYEHRFFNIFIKKIYVPLIKIINTLKAHKKPSKTNSTYQNKKNFFIITCPIEL